MRLLSVLIGGTLFGYGLALSGMTKPEVVLSFLQLRDLGLLFVMGGAFVVTIIAYTFLPRLMKKPILGGAFKKKETEATGKTLLGGAIFGLGWGVSGLCPGSAIASIGIGNWPILIGIAGMLIGAYLHGRFIR